jgi:amidase
MSVLKPVPKGLLQAFRAYESALMSHDVAALDDLLADAPTTLHADASGLLVGFEEIAAVRAGRGGVTQRTIVQTHVQVVDETHALIVAVTEPVTGGRGLQTQLWAREPTRAAYGGWQVTAAHVTVPGPALDPRVWRIVGDPLVPATDDDGPLSGETVAVKDLYAVAGHATGLGSPAWLAQAPAATVHAWAVGALLDAGASIRGIARTDEFAYSLAGLNEHYGAPPNPRAPYRVPGGSSSGSASAVSLGHATVGLGTDTGGSIRIPAAYQGLYGIRTTHGAVSRDGLAPLAPSFDTVGWMTRSAFTLRAVGDVLLPDAEPHPIEDLVAVPALLDLADAGVAEAVRGWLPPETRFEDASLTDLDAWRDAFTTLQAYEAWQSNGAWLAPRLDTLTADVRGRFELGRATTEDDAEAARRIVASARRQIRAFVGDRALVLPAAPTVAPTPALAPGVREATLRLTCIAGLGGLPAVTVPVRTASGLPVGVCLVAGAGRDRDLLDRIVSHP